MAKPAAKYLYTHGIQVACSCAFHFNKLDSYYGINEQLATRCKMRAL